MSEQKKNKRVFSAKTVAILMVMVLLLGGVMGGTMAWLIDKTAPVVNTFTYGDINIGLAETDDGDANLLANEYKMIPGATITKDPVLTVYGGSEKAWVFVKLEKSGGNVTVDGVDYTFDSFLEYDIYESVDKATNYVWTKLYPASTETTEVYFALIDQSAAGDNEIAILKDNTVRVKTSVTKEMVNALDAENKLDSTKPTKYPQLAITGYAVQYTATSELNASETDPATRDALNALEAWKLAEPPVTP